MNELNVLKSYLQGLGFETIFKDDPAINSCFHLVMKSDAEQFIRNQVSGVVCRGLIKN